jgi:hypothetical protein
MDLKIGCKELDCINLAQYIAQRRVCVNFRVPCVAENILTDLLLISEEVITLLVVWQPLMLNV